MAIIYWCEFPKEMDWKKLASWIGTETVSIYLPVETRKEYEQWKKKIQKISKNIEVNAWHVLPFNEGYWHSGFSRKKSLDKLDQFKGVKLKIDIEPWKPEGKYYFWMAIKWLVFNLFKKAKNRKYLQEKIHTMSKESNVIISTFPIPSFLRKRWGWVEDRNALYNFMYYTTFLPQCLIWFYNNLYYRWFIKANPKAFFAIGLIGTGIFTNEPIYTSINHMKKDIIFLKKQGVQNIAFFRIGAIVERGKEWYDATRA